MMLDTEKVDLELVKEVITDYLCDEFATIIIDRIEEVIEENGYYE